MDRSGLTKDQISSIRAVFSKYHHADEVLIYGSRAKGNFKPASDTDLTLIGKVIDLRLHWVLKNFIFNSSRGR